MEYVRGAPHLAHLPSFVFVTVARLVFFDEARPI